MIKWYWKAYFVLILALGYGQLARKILTDTGGFSSRYAAAIIATLLVCVLIARFKNQAIGKRWLWIGVFSALSLGATLMLLFGIYLLVTGVMFSAALLLIGALVLLPALQQLYEYGFRSDKLWS